MRILNAGLIGCGSFQRGMHVPNLTANPKYKIRAAMDVIEDPARKMAEDLDLEYWTTDLGRLLSDEELDVVFVSTVHDTHAELSVKAAEAGKHILCEKPMGLSREQCRAVANAVKSSGVKYTVGYNRGMAPLVTQAREMIKGVPGKKLIYHRMQDSFPEEHWTHDPARGGGRFVGEGCHNFDLLCRLVDAPPVTVYASGGTFLDPDRVKIPDSGIVTITFADGSVGTTLIASAGCQGFPKEVTEIYVNGKSIYIDSFKDMICCGFDGQDRVKVELPAVDKGHAVQIDLLADSILNDTPSPNGIVNAARAAIVSFAVNESIAAGAPVSISESDYNF